VNMADERVTMGRYLRGGPPWTTKLRMVLILPLVIPTAIVYGACVGIIQLLSDVVDAYRVAFAKCDRETVRRLDKKGSDDR